MNAAVLLYLGVFPWLLMEAADWTPEAGLALADSKTWTRETGLSKQ